MTPLDTEITPFLMLCVCFFIFNTIVQAQPIITALWLVWIDH